MARFYWPRASSLIVLAFAATAVCAIRPVLPVPGLVQIRVRNSPCGTHPTHPSAVYFRISLLSWNLRLSGKQACFRLAPDSDLRFCSALTERSNLASDPSLYANGGAKLLAFLADHEAIAALSGRYDYGKLEYPFTLPLVVPDKATKGNPFPPGRFHQDAFSGNKNITAFYLDTLIPFFNSPTSFYYHLDNSTLNDDAILNADATLLALLSHR